MILVDTQNQMFTPLIPRATAHLYSHLVFAANGSAVDTTIIDGQVVYAEPRVHDDRRAEVLHEANVAFRSVLDSDGRALLRRPTSRTLVLGDPVVALG